ncbi:hypothetical protein A33Q_2513 [Indibacter alkaliphilus LW1]|uniref:Uncharacterized protein n=1 Tax=Indibacter alkaliphilus (strain CCUG 57479 / KCTC 22604 / LW1) TaxID=1189612 RepID=S2DFT2_INDAL|nr:hypothetical protein A33Q_2513 [Indibacter alkaliphilus LW1]
MLPAPNHFKGVFVEKNTQLIYCFNKVFPHYDIPSHTYKIPFFHNRTV